MDAAKAFEKIQHSLMIKVQQKNRNRMNVPQYNKGYM
jgi:hypothetical protein